MKKIAIKAENLSKVYQLGAFSTGTISRDIERWFYKVRGKEDPFLKIGETNDRTTKGDSDVVWSLKDINFDIIQGEAVGIIGRNGAGKSTLLKILSRVTTPTTGRVRIKGRIASLLEVGTGFHPELTGRENIFLNGAILGMRRNEIKRKFDEIVDFAGVERYIDTPVKRYSSGMYVRLAFAVAAHLDSEILIVDEVLAVGDAEFQKKCLGKMNSVSTSEGKTILFVSHNMASVSQLCKKAILLKDGIIKYEGATADVVSEYLKMSSSGSALGESMEHLNRRRGNAKVVFSKFYALNRRNEKSNVILTGDEVFFVFEVIVNDPNVQKIDIGFSIHDSFDNMHTVLYSSYQNVYYRHGNENRLTIKCRVQDFNFAPGDIIVRGRIEADGFEADWPEFELGNLKVEMGDFYQTGSIGHYRSNTTVLIKGEWF